MKHRHSCSRMSDRFNIITDALYSQGKLNFIRRLWVFTTFALCRWFLPLTCRRIRCNQPIVRDTVLTVKMLLCNCWRCCWWSAILLWRCFLQLRILRYSRARCAAGYFSFCELHFITFSHTLCSLNHYLFYQDYHWHPTTSMMAIFDYSVLCRRLHWKEIRIVRDAWRCCSMSRTYRFHLILCVWRVLMKNESDFTNLGYRVTGYTRFWRKGQLCRCNDGWWC